MLTVTRNWIMAGMLGMLVACGGGGGGNSAPGVQPGPPPPGQPIPPEPIPPTPAASPYALATVLHAFITEASLNADNQPVVSFQLTDGNGVAITDLEAGNVRFVVSKLETSPLGNLTGMWQSYTNRIEVPDVGTGTGQKLQATSESDGEFTNSGDGNYSYRYTTQLTSLSQDILDQAQVEGLDLAYDSRLTHRVAIQFDGAPGAANPHRDWVPATGATDGVFSMDIAATANCNRCHDTLAVHGGGRREIQYCVTCHNPGSTDANSTNTVDFKVMIHKIHRGVNLPTVLAGEPYKIYGFRDSLHDYSGVHFPQDVRNCVNCHAGSATGTGLKYPDGSDYSLTLTSQGDNWSVYAAQAACGSCHDDLDFATHAGGQTDDSNCASCHSTGGVAGSIRASHSILANRARQRFAASILAVSQTATGEFPSLQYKVFDPTNADAPYDLLNDPVWTAGGGASRLAIDLAWNTTDYTNSGNNADDASAVSLDALTGTPVGDGSYIIESNVAVPDGSQRPFIPASGSAVAAIEGHPAVDLGSNSEPDIQQVPFTNAVTFFSIDEPDGLAVTRRTSVELGNCLTCHQTLSVHGSNRTDNEQVCVACHNPRNTDRGVRKIAVNPPTDGKGEESLDFKTMIHGIHAAGMRENALQIVGFRGFSTHVYNEEEVQYPGNLANCTACHTAAGYTLPLPDGVLATSIDTGIDLQSPVDDTVISPITAVCSSCHDGTEATSHMVLQGGSFSATQEAIDAGDVVETCNICHSSGKDADVVEVHDIPPM